MRCKWRSALSAVAVLSLVVTAVGAQNHLEPGPSSCEQVSQPFDCTSSSWQIALTADDSETVANETQQLGPQVLIEAFSPAVLPATQSASLRRSGGPPLRLPEGTPMDNCVTACHRADRSFGCAAVSQLRLSLMSARDQPVGGNFRSRCLLWAHDSPPTGLRATLRAHSAALSTEAHAAARRAAHAGDGDDSQRDQSATAVIVELLSYSRRRRRPAPPPDKASMGRCTRKRTPLEVFMLWLPPQPPRAPSDAAEGGASSAAAVDGGDDGRPELRVITRLVTETLADEEVVVMTCGKQRALQLTQALLDEKNNGGQRRFEPWDDESSVPLGLRSAMAVKVRRGSVLQHRNPAENGCGIVIVDALLPDLGACDEPGWQPSQALHRWLEVYDPNNGTAWGAQLPPSYITLIAVSDDTSVVEQLDVMHHRDRMRSRDPRRQSILAAKVWRSPRFSRMDGALQTVATLTGWRTQLAAMVAAYRDGRYNFTEAGTRFAAVSALYALKNDYHRLRDAAQLNTAHEQLLFASLKHGVTMTVRSVSSVSYAARQALAVDRCRLESADEQFACEVAHAQDADDFTFGLPFTVDPSLFHP